MDVLQNTFELFCQQATTVITTVINKKITFTPETCEKADFDTIKQKISSVVFILKINFKNGLEGDCYIIIKKKEVALLSDLMMMGDGTAEYSEDHKDAIGELFNQVIGAYTTSLGSEMGITTSINPLEVSEFDLDNPSIASDTFDMLMIPIQIEDNEDSFISILISNNINNQIADKKSGESLVIKITRWNQPKRVRNRRIIESHIV